MRIGIRERLFFVCTIFLFFSSIKIEAQLHSKFVDYLNIENKILFADYLFCEKDYNRAIEEYRDILRNRENDTLRFKIGFSLIEMGRYEEAEDNLKSLFFNSKLSDDARLLFFKSNLIKSDLNKFDDFAESNRRYLSDNHNGILNRISSFSQLLKNGIDSTLLMNSFPIENSEIANTLFKKFGKPKYVSPKTAAIISAIVPGAGKVYIGETSDGITTFLLTVTLGVLSSVNFRAGHDLKGWMYAGLSGFFYAGNIYGTYAAAVKSNREYNVNFRLNLNSIFKKNNYFFPDYEFFCN